MTPDPALRTDLLSAGVPTFVIVLLPLLLGGLWVAGHAVSGRLLKAGHPRSAHAGAFAARVAVGTVALWTLWQAVARFIVLETSWSLWTSAFIGALAVEIVTLLFQWEKAIVARGMGRALLALRLLAVALVLLILVQPVLAWTQQRKIERRVVVLVDDSESMQLVDRQATPTEKVELAGFRRAGPATARPAFGPLATAGRAFQDTLGRELDAWPATAPTDPEAEKSLVTGRTEALAAVVEAGLALAILRC
jgi:signal transduction histidine kinase